MDLHSGQELSLEERSAPEPVGQAVSTTVRVLSVMHPFRPAFSGEVEWWLRMIPLLRTRGIDVEVLTSANGSCVRDPVTEIVEGVVVHTVSYRTRAVSYWTWFDRIRSIVAELIRQRKRFDIVLFPSTNYDAVFASCVIGRFFGWKTIFKMTLYGSDDLITIRQSGKLGGARLAMLRLAHGFISISRALSRSLEQTGLGKQKLLVVPQGLDLERFRPTDSETKLEARSRLEIPASARVVLFCGALVQRKGVDILLNAWCQVSRRLGDAVLLMVGPNGRSGGRGDDENWAFADSMLWRIEETPELKRSVLVFGFQKEVEKFYAAADVFVLASRREGWPNVIAEAMASGLPCVVAWMDGLAEEYVRDNEDGIIVRSDVASDYAAQLTTLLSRQDVARRMGQQARQRAVRELQIERVADRYAAFMREIHDGAGGGPQAKAS